MGFYDVTHSNLALQNIPPKKRKPRLTAYIYCIVEALQVLHEEVFTAFREDIIQRLRFNSQTIVLEGILNQTFNFTFRQPGIIEPVTKSDIWIDNNSDNLDHVYLSQASESYPPNYLFNASETPDPQLYLYNKSEFKPPFDFTVYVPTFFYNDPTSLLQVKAEIEKHIIVGVNYEVKPYISSIEP